MSISKLVNIYVSLIVLNTITILNLAHKCGNEIDVGLLSTVQSLISSAFPGLTTKTMPNGLWVNCQMPSTQIPVMAYACDFHIKVTIKNP